MFSTRDLNGFVSNAAEALELKFGKWSHNILLHLRSKLHFASLVPFPTTGVGAIMNSNWSALFCLLSNNTAVHNAGEIEGESTIVKPEFTHQVFGEK